MLRSRECSHTLLVPMRKAEEARLERQTGVFECLYPQGSGGFGRLFSRTVKHKQNSRRSVSELRVESGYPEKTLTGLLPGAERVAMRILYSVPLALLIVLV